MSSPNHGFGSAAPTYGSGYYAGTTSTSTPTAQPASASGSAPAPAPAPGSTGSAGSGGGFGGFDRLASLATAALAYCQVTSPDRPIGSTQAAPAEETKAKRKYTKRSEYWQGKGQSPSGAAAAAAAATGNQSPAEPTILDASASSAPLYNPPSSEKYNVNTKAWADAYGYRVTKRKYTKRSEYWQGMGQSPSGAAAAAASEEAATGKQSPAKPKVGGGATASKKAKKDDDANSPAKKKPAVKRSASTKRGGAAAVGDDAASGRGKTRGQARYVPHRSGLHCFSVLY